VLRSADGVRINEAFGDVTNRDLLPGSAISTIQRTLRMGMRYAIGQHALIER
jgi:hypothetical protein